MISIDLGEADNVEQAVIEAGKAIASLKIFDFTVPLEMMDEETKSVYYRIRRVALTAKGGEFKADNGKGDASLLPDGKIYTESEVIEILGPDYLAGLVINTKCCN